MSILKVARLGHPVLRRIANDVASEDIRSGKLDSVITDMFETMTAYEGVGLAGPQVHLPLRIFVYGVDAEIAIRKGVATIERDVLFNATLVVPAGDPVTDWEGCLSVPFLAGKVPRAREVVLRGLDRHGEPKEVRAEGYLARIFQHEIDHTDGRVYLDRMPDLTTLGYTVVL